MIFDSIVVEGFRSYGPAQRMQFPRRPGLYNMAGRNLHRPELGANRVGKSSLWDAIIWCLTGVTSRGLKAGNVANWQGKHPCRVTLVLREPDHRISRTWKPNTLTLDGQPITQAELEATLGVNWEILTTSVLMSQFGKYFFDLTATEKLTLFSGLFDLEYWLRLADKARTGAKEAEGRVTKAAEARAKLEGSLDTTREQLKTDRERRDAWAESHEATVDRLLEEYEKANERAITVAGILRKARKQLEGDEGRKADAQRALVRADEALRDNARPEYQSAKAQVEALEADLERAQEQAVAMREIEGTCPACYRPVTKACVEDAVAAHRAETIVPLRDRLAKATDLYATAKDVVDAAIEKRKASETAYSDAENDVECSRAAVSRAAKATASADADTKAAERRWKDAQDEENPHERSVMDLEDKRAALKIQLTDATTAEADARTEHDRASYWVGGFKDLRLWLIERALLDFEVCVNNALVELNLPDWKISFDVERETKSGTVSKGFTVNIESPESGGPVPWEVWSGGETQRLRIAGALGLSDLVRARRGFAPSIEVWDEPTAHLSREGVDDLLRFFAARAAEQGRQVWLVDHVAHASGDVVGRVTVVRDTDGWSRIDATGDAAPPARVNGPATRSSRVGRPSGPRTARVRPEGA